MPHPRAVRSLMIAGTVGALALHGLVPASASPAGGELSAKSVGYGDRAGDTAGVGERGMPGDG